MHKLHFPSLLLIVVSLLLLHCVEDDEMSMEPALGPDYERLDIVTGLDFIDENGQPIGRWGFPNHKPGPTRAFPNPSTGVLALFSPDEISQIWLIPASCAADSVSTDIPGQSANLTYRLTALDSAQVRYLDLPDGTVQAQLNFEDVSTGFYRLFYQLATDSVYWQNLFIDPSVNNFPDYYSRIDGLCE